MGEHQMKKLERHMKWSLHGDREKGGNDEKNDRKTILDQVNAWVDAGKPDNMRNWHHETRAAYRRMHNRMEHKDAISDSEDCTDEEHLIVATDIQQGRR